MPEIKFDAKPVDKELIRMIVERVGESRVSSNLPWDTRHVQTQTMDITACHLNGCPLKLRELLKAEDFNFMHDIAGISAHIDRRTGKLLNHFIPRYAK